MLGGQSRKQKPLRDCGERLQPVRGEGARLRALILQNQMRLSCEPNFYLAAVLRGYKLL